MNKLATISFQRTLAHVLADLTEARRDFNDALVGDPPDDDRATEADQRMDAFREEFETMFRDLTGLTWAQILSAIQEAVL